MGAETLEEEEDGEQKYGRTRWVASIFSHSCLSDCLPVPSSVLRDTSDPSAVVLGNVGDAEYAKRCHAEHLISTCLNMP